MRHKIHVQHDWECCSLIFALFLYLNVYHYFVFSSHLGRIWPVSFICTVVQYIGCMKKISAWMNVSHRYMDLPWLTQSEDTCYVALSLLQLSPQPAKQFNANEKQTVTETELIYHPMNFCKKKIDLDKMHFFIRYENVQICCHFGPPFAPVFPWFGMSCDVDSGTCDLTQAWLISLVLPQEVYM